MVYAARRYLPSDEPVAGVVTAAPATDTGLDQLSARELEVARLVAKGFANKEIAQFLDISHWTVAAHLKSTFLKTGVRRRSELAYVMRRIV